MKILGVVFCMVNYHRWHEALAIIYGEYESCAPEECSLSRLGHPRFGTVTRSYLIPMDHGEKWSVLINYSLDMGYGGPRLEREHSSGAQLSYSP